VDGVRAELNQASLVLSAHHDSTSRQPADVMASGRKHNSLPGAVDGGLLQAATGKGAGMGFVPAERALLSADGAAREIVGWTATKKLISTFPVVPVLCG
jgi:hypothetical protein